MAERPDEFDPALWVQARGYEGRLLLGYNPHLRPGSGRIGVWSEEHRSATRISTADITAASDSARVWLAGFFAGCEPEPHDMFGPGIHDAPAEDPRWQRYWDASKRFRETGEWPAKLWVELTPFTAEADLPPHVHTVRGDEMWVWDGCSWILADPQPDHPFELLEGTVCADRRHHAMTLVDPGHLVCDDCGHTTEVEPDQPTAPGSCPRSSLP